MVENDEKKKQVAINIAHHGVAQILRELWE